MTKPEYIKKIEDQFGILSQIFYGNLNLEQFNILDSKLDTVWSSSTYIGDGKVSWGEKIYKTKQDFYLSMTISTITNPSNLKQMEIRLCDIYYRQEQFNELIFFIKSLSKELENARNNDTTN